MTKITSAIFIGHAYQPHLLSKVHDLADAKRVSVLAKVQVGLFKQDVTVADTKVKSCNPTKYLSPPKTVLHSTFLADLEKYH